MVYVHRDPMIEAGILDLVMRERRKANSEMDWKNRLRGYGYTLQENAGGVFVATLPHGVEVCQLPQGTLH